MPIRPGQTWRPRAGGKPLTIGKRASGNGHWYVSRPSGRAHKIHEGTLRKFYTCAR